MELACTDVADCAELRSAAETVSSALLLAPFQVAVSTIHPLGKLCAVTVKAAETEPSGTVALVGMLRARSLVEIPTVMAPAAFERITVQVLLPPTVSAAGLQVRVTIVGVDHNAKVAVLDDAPRVTVITPEASAAIAPAVALNPVLLPPAGTVTLAGTFSSGELEMSDTGVFATTVCASVTVQVVVPADIKPVRLQSTEVTCTGATRLIVAGAEVLL
jgi:hypothetical protein